MTLFYSTFETPIGPFLVAVNENKAVVATAFGKLPALKKRLRECHLLSDIQKTSEIRRQVNQYFIRKRRTFELDLAPSGTVFQHAVWDALSQIPMGQIRSYGQIAESIERPRAARAVGRANATNPICLIVPCHRVIGANGTLTGFAFGESLKRRLLLHEDALPASFV